MKYLIPVYTLTKKEKKEILVYTTQKPWTKKEKAKVDITFHLIAVFILVLSKHSIQPNLTLGQAGLKLKINLFFFLLTKIQRNER